MKVEGSEQRGVSATKVRTVGKEVARDSVMIWPEADHVKDSICRASGLVKSGWTGGGKKIRDPQLDVPLDDAPFLRLARTRVLHLAFSLASLSLSPLSLSPAREYQ